MTDSPGGLPPAGWYPDPYGAPYERWWDGAQWTEHTTTPPAAEPEQPIYQAPAEAVAPVTAEPAYEQPVYEQPSYEEPVYEQPANNQPSYEQPTTDQSGWGQPSFEQPTHEQPTYEQPSNEQPEYPEYESTFEATQQQPSPSWGAPVSAAPAAAATPAPSFDELFGTQPQAAAPASTSDSDNPFAFSAPTAEPAYNAPFTAEPAFEKPVIAEPAFQSPATAEQPADPFGGLPASGSPAVAPQSYTPPASTDAAFDFGRIVSGAPASGQPGVDGDSDQFSNWSNEEYVDPPRNSAATASLTFGILSFFIPAVAGLIGLVFGALGILRANRFAADGEGPVGRTKSFVGIALSVIGSAVSIALVLFVLPGIINPSSNNSVAGTTTDDGSSIVAAAPGTINGGIALAEGDLATITFPGTDEPSIQFSVTGITVNPTCTEDPELVLSPDNGQFIAITMTFTTSADYTSQMSTGGLLLVSPTDFSGYLADGTSVLSTDAGISCIPEAEQLPDGIPAGETVTATMILDLSDTATSITYSPVGVTDLEPTQTFWEWTIPR